MLNNGMAAIRLVLDDELLDLADQVAKLQQVNRSALIREALRAHLKKLRYQELERQERDAYRRQPEDIEEIGRWEIVADWPDD